MYHRVADLHDPGFDLFKPTVSATVAAFEKQVAFVSRHFNPVSIQDLLSYLAGKTNLPSRPLLVTFDDGYRDNFEVAWPILKRYGVPTAIFLATDFIEAGRYFYWDMAAYCFFHTRLDQADLPLAGRMQWETDSQKEQVMRRWTRLLLDQPDAARRSAIEKLFETLGVTYPEEAFSDLCLTWDQVRMLNSSGVYIGAHTESHPVLDRLEQEDVIRELNGSRDRIQNETGRPVTAFAYPAGVFNPGLKRKVGQAGFQLAFCTRPGPMRLSDALNQPMAIRRITISHKDGFQRFVAKLSGLQRLWKGRI